jgi:hypothetical protein
MATSSGNRIEVKHIPSDAFHVNSGFAEKKAVLQQSIRLIQSLYRQKKVPVTTDEKKLCHSLGITNLETLDTFPLSLEEKSLPALAETIRQFLHDILKNEIEKKEHKDPYDEPLCDDLTDQLLQIAKGWPLGYDEKNKTFFCTILNDTIVSGREVYTAAGYCYDIEALADHLQKNADFNPNDRSKFSQRELLSFQERGRELGVNINTRPDPSVRREEIENQTLTHLFGLNWNAQDVLPESSISQNMQIFATVLLAFTASLTLLFFFISPDIFSVMSPLNLLSISGTGILCGLGNIIIKENEDKWLNFVSGALSGLVGAMAMSSTIFVCTALFSFCFPFPPFTTVWPTYHIYAPILFLAPAIFDRNIEKAAQRLCKPVILITGVTLFLVGLTIFTFLSVIKKIIIDPIVNLYLFSSSNAFVSPPPASPRNSQSQAVINSTLMAADSPTLNPPVNSPVMMDSHTATTPTLTSAPSLSPVGLSSTTTAAALLFHHNRTSEQTLQTDAPAFTFPTKPAHAE